MGPPGRPGPAGMNVSLHQVLLSILNTCFMNSIHHREKQVNRDPQAPLEFHVSRVLVDQEVQMVDVVLLGPLVCLDPRGPKEALVQMVLQEN